MDMPTPDEIERARVLITDPKHLPEDRSLRSQTLTARAMGLIQFRASDELNSAEHNIRGIRAALIAERAAQHELWPELYADRPADARNWLNAGTAA